MPKFSNLAEAPYSIDLKKSELRNAVVQNLGTAPSTPSNGQVYYDSATNNALTVRENGAWVTYYKSSTPLNNITAPSGDLSLNGQKITNLGTPTLSTDAVTLAYVQGLITGNSWKTPVRAIATSNGTLASAFANGSTVDGVSLVTGDRIALVGQTTGSQNGIYVVAASGAPTRATDADSGAEMLAATFVVTEGTTYADTTWTCTTNATITVGTTSLTFVQIGQNALTFSNGVTKSGNAVSANVDGVFITTASNQLTIVTGSGGVARKYVGTITGNSSNTSFAITHSLGTKDVTVQVRGTAGTDNDVQVIPDVAYTSTSVVTLSWGAAPATGDNYSVTVIG